MDSEQLGGQFQIRADRACICCGFNLYGQPVTKEEHYGLAITRCPECGTVAALQSYPTMTHWVARFRLVLSSLWILILLGAFAANMFTYFGFSMGATEIASQDLSEIIGQEHSLWVEEQTLLAQEQINPQTGSDDQAEAVPENNESEADTSDTSTASTSTAQNTPSTVTTQVNGMTTTITTNADGSTSTTINGVTTTNWGNGYTWSTVTPIWRDQYLDATITTYGGLWACIDREFMILFLPASFVAFASGLFWSITMLGSRKRTAIFVPIFAALLAAVLAISAHTIDGNTVWASQLASSVVSVQVITVMMIFMAVFASLGVFFGRRFARLVVLMSLPPRGRTSLSALWTRDGLEMPKPKLR